MFDLDGGSKPRERLTEAEFLALSPWELLRLAVHDMELVEAMPGHELDMSSWWIQQTGTGGRCLCCAAGAVAIASMGCFTRDDMEAEKDFQKPWLRPASRYWFIDSCRVLRYARWNGDPLKLGKTAEPGEGLDSALVKKRFLDIANHLEREYPELARQEAACTDESVARVW